MIKRLLPILALSIAAAAASANLVAYDISGTVTRDSSFGEAFPVDSTWYAEVYFDPSIAQTGTMPLTGDQNGMTDYKWQLRGFANTTAGIVLRDSETDVREVTTSFLGVYLDTGSTVASPDGTTHIQIYAPLSPFDTSPGGASGHYGGTDFVLSFDAANSNLLPSAPTASLGDIPLLSSGWTSTSASFQRDASSPFNDGFTIRSVSEDSIELAPEPGSLCVLGLGGLALMRRKRRGGK